MQVRVATANLHGLRAGAERAAGVFGAEEVDLAMVQESGPRHSFRAMAELLGMDPVVDPPVVLRRRVQDGLLVRGPWRVAAVEYHRFARSALMHPRGAVIASLVHGEGTLWVVSTHFGFVGAERRRHTLELLEHLAGRRPFVLGGDLNVGEDARVIALLREVAIDVGSTAGATYPASAPAERIDYLFVSPEIEITRVSVTGTASASDHLAVVADLDLPAS